MLLGSLHRVSSTGSPSTIPYPFHFWPSGSRHHRPSCLHLLSVLGLPLATRPLHCWYEIKMTWSWAKGRCVVTSKSIWTPVCRIQITLLNACLYSFLDSDPCKDRVCLYLGSLALNTMLKESKLIVGRISVQSQSDLIVFTTHFKWK